MDVFEVVGAIATLQQPGCEKDSSELLSRVSRQVWTEDVEPCLKLTLTLRESGAKPVTRGGGPWPFGDQVDSSGWMSVKDGGADRCG